MKYNKGDIVKLNKNAFKDNGEGYNCSSSGHLFVVMQNINDELVCCIISSANKINDKYKYNIPIKDYKEVNLNKPFSHVKVDRQTIKIPEKYILNKIGHLSTNDYINIITAFRKVNVSDIQVLEDLQLFDFLRSVK